MIYIFLATVLVSLVVITGALAGRALNSNLAATIANITAAVISAGVVFATVKKLPAADEKMGIIYAIAGGIFVGFYSLALTKALSVNKVAIVAPIVFGGMIFITAAVSYFLFKEKISLFQGIGLALLFLGLIFITYARWTGR